MANQWLRLYSEFANDPKMQMMSEANQRRFVMVLCIRCSNGDVTLQDEEVAFQLRISNEEWAATKAVFVAKNLISDNNKPTAWDKRQFVSDSSAPRVARHRAKLKTASNVTETAPEQIQNRTDTESEPKEEAKALAKKPPTRAHAMPPDFYPDENGVAYADSRRISVLVELESFRNWHNAKGSTMKSWQAAWRTWCDKAVEFGRAGQSKGQAPPHKQFISHADQSKLAAARAIFGTEIEGNHGTQSGRTIDITPPARQVGRENFSGASGQLRLQVSEPVEDGSIVT